MKVKKIQIVLMAILIAVPTLIFSQAKITGLQIIEKVYNRETGNDMQGDLTMSLINSRGDQRVRKIKQFVKDFGNMEKKIMFFVTPADVRGSDFTYDDLGDRHPTEDNHKLLREETIDGENCYVVESIPKDEEYMYSRTVTWIIKDKWIGLKKEFYDEDEELLKTLSVKKYEKIKGYWTILSSEMNNVQKDHTTKMELANVKLDTGIPANKFTERMMKRGLK